MKLKKLAVYVLTVALLLSCAVLSIHAASPFTVTLSETEAAAGETVTLELSVANNTDLAALSVRVYYPADVVTCVSADAEVGIWAARNDDSAMQNANANDTKNISDERVNAGWAMASLSWLTTADGGMTTASGVIGELTFTVAEDAAAETYALEVEVVQATDASNANLTDAVAVDGGITVTPKHFMTHFAAKDPTCEEEGNIEYWYCSDCDSYFSDENGENEIELTDTVIDMLPHTEETVKGTPATCTATGLTDGVKCSVCGETLVEQEEIPMLDHNYVDGSCTNCGEKDPNAELTDAKLKFMSKALSLQDYIGIQCIMQKSLSNGYDRVYALIEYADGTTAEATPTVYMTNYYVFEVPMLSTQMCEEVTFTLYGEKDGAAYKGESATNSVRGMGMTILNSTSTTAAVLKNKAVVANMLNYGATVQSAFDINADDLANAQMTEAHQAYATQGTPTMSATNTTTGSGTVNPANVSLSMQDKVEMQFIFSQKDMSAYEAHVTVGGETTVVDGAAFELYYGSYRLLRVAVKAAELREDYTITIHDKSTGDQVSKTYTRSVQAFANSLLGGTYNDVAIAMMKYGDAVAAIS